MQGSAATQIFTVDQLVPLYEQDVARINFNLGQSVIAAKGSLMGLRAAAQNQTFVTGYNATVSGGTFNLVCVNPLTGVETTVSSIAYNASNGTLQTALEAAYGSGNVAVSGSGLPSNATTITLQGRLAGMPAATPTLVGTALTGGGSITIAAGAAGRSAGTLDLYTTLKLSNPSTAPSVSGTGAAGGFAAGAYAVTYTLVTAEGETLPSPMGTIALTAGQSIRVAAISSLNARVTSVRYYVNGQYAKATTPSGGTAAQTDIAMSEVTGAGFPRWNGTGNPRAIAPCALAADATGHIFMGPTATPYISGDQGVLQFPFLTHGKYRSSDIVGLDSDAVEALRARFLAGSLSAGGVVAIPGC